MTKEKLKRLKALLLAGVLCLSLSGCSKEKEEKVEHNPQDSIVLFIQGKALIYSGDLENFVTGDGYSRIGGNAIVGTEITRFSGGVQAVDVKSREDAIELATLIVGEENIIILDYVEDDMQFTSYVKQKTNNGK